MREEAVRHSEEEGCADGRSQGGRGGQRRSRGRTMLCRKCGPSFLSLIAELIFFCLCAGWRRSSNTKQGSTAPARCPQSLDPEDTELAAVIAVPLVGLLLLQSFSPEKPGDPLQSTTPPPDRKGGVLDCQQPLMSAVHMDITMILQFWGFITAGICKQRQVEINLGREVLNCQQLQLPLFLHICVSLFFPPSLPQLADLLRLCFQTLARLWRWLLKLQNRQNVPRLWTLSGLLDASLLPALSNFSNFPSSVSLFHCGPVHVRRRHGEL